MTMGPTCKSSLYYCKTYPYCFWAFVLAAVGCVALTIAVCSPYWLVSKTNSSSEFVRLGLWSVCFKKYHHPSLSPVLDGCYPLHRHKSEELRRWLQPAWFILVQCLITCATCLSGLCVCLLCYMSFQVEMEIKIFVAGFVFVFEAISGFVVFLSACIFAAMSFEKSWIKYPKTNVLSWGFGFSIISALLLIMTAGCLLVQTLKMRKVLARDNRSYNIPLSNRPMSY